MNRVRRRKQPIADRCRYIQTSLDTFFKASKRELIMKKTWESSDDSLPEDKRPKKSRILQPLVDSDSDKSWVCNLSKASEVPWKCEEIKQDSSSESSGHSRHNPKKKLRSKRKCVGSSAWDAASFESDFESDVPGPRTTRRINMLSSDNDTDVQFINSSDSNLPTIAEEEIVTSIGQSLAENVASTSKIAPSKKIVTIMQVTKSEPVSNKVEQLKPRILQTQTLSFKDKLKANRKADMLEKQIQNNEKYFTYTSENGQLYVGLKNVIEPTPVNINAYLEKRIAGTMKLSCKYFSEPYKVAPTQSDINALDTICKNLQELTNLVSPQLIDEGTKENTAKNKSVQTEISRGAKRKLRGPLSRRRKDDYSMVVNPLHTNPEKDEKIVDDIVLANKSPLKRKNEDIEHVQTEPQKIKRNLRARNKINLESILETSTSISQAQMVKSTTMINNLVEESLKTASTSSAIIDLTDTETPVPNTRPSTSTRDSQLHKLLTETPNSQAIPAPPPASGNVPVIQFAWVINDPQSNMQPTQTSPQKLMYTSQIIAPPLMNDVSASNLLTSLSKHQQSITGIPQGQTNLAQSLPNQQPIFLIAAPSGPNSIANTLGQVSSLPNQSPLMIIQPTSTSSGTISYAIKNNPTTMKNCATAINNSPTTINNNPTTINNSPTTNTNSPSTINSPTTMKNSPTTLKNNPTTSSNKVHQKVAKKSTSTVGPKNKDSATTRKVHKSLLQSALASTTSSTKTITSLGKVHESLPTAATSTSTVTTSPTSMGLTSVSKAQSLPKSTKDELPTAAVASSPGKTHVGPKSRMSLHSAKKSATSSGIETLATLKENSEEIATSPTRSCSSNATINCDYTNLDLEDYGIYVEKENEFPVIDLLGEDSSNGSTHLSDVFVDKNEANTETGNVLKTESDATNKTTLNADQEKSVKAKHKPNILRKRSVATINPTELLEESDASSKKRNVGAAIIESSTTDTNTSSKKDVDVPRITPGSKMVVLRPTETLFLNLKLLESNTTAATQEKTVATGASKEITHATTSSQEKNDETASSQEKTDETTEGDPKTISEAQATPIVSESLETDENRIVIGTKASAIVDAVDTNSTTDVNTKATESLASSTVVSCATIAAKSVVSDGSTRITETIASMEASTSKPVSNVFVDGVSTEMSDDEDASNDLDPLMNSDQSNDASNVNAEKNIVEPETAKTDLEETNPAPAKKVRIRLLADLQDPFYDMDSSQDSIRSEENEESEEICAPNDGSINFDFLENSDQESRKGKTYDPRDMKELRKIMRHVYSSPNLYSVLYEQEIKMLFDFFTMDSSYQYVCFKFFTRLPKWYNMLNFVNTELKMALSEEKVTEMLQFLKAKKFINTDYSAVGPADLLHGMLKDDVKDIFNSFKIRTKKGTTKEKYIVAILSYCNKQTTLTRAKSSTGVLMDRIRDKMKESVRLDHTFHHILFRLHLLYSFTNPDLLKIHDLYRYMVDIDLENIVLPRYTIDYSPVFMDRTEFDGFSKATECYIEYNIAKEKKKKTMMTKILDVVYNELQKLLKVNNDISKKPSFLKYHTAGSVYAKTLTLGCQDFTTDDHLEVITWLTLLTNQDQYCSSKRGLWMDQLAMVYDKYEKNVETAVQIIAEGLKDERLSIVDKHNLSARGRTIKSRKNVLILDALPDSLLLDPPDKVPFKIETVNAQAQSGTEPGRKRLYVKQNKDGGKSFLTVESVALEHYEEQGFSGIHCEGSLILSLFTLLFWDVIYDVFVPGAFISEIQRVPLDLFSTRFYENRKEQIEKRMNEIQYPQKGATDTVQALLLNHKFHSEKKSIVDCTPYTITVLSTALSVMGGKTVCEIFKRLVMNFREFRAGMPDLFLWNPFTKKYKFVEVKGQNDTLSMKQKLWLQYLISIGVDAEVCYVHTIGSKGGKKVAVP